MHCYGREIDINALFISHLSVIVVAFKKGYANIIVAGKSMTNALSIIPLVCDVLFRKNCCINELP